MTKQGILIVDDRPQNLLVLEKTLDVLGAELVKATSGEEALEATLEQDFALAILDVQMPGMDGYELAELLRGDAQTRHLPIIFLTATSSEEEQIFKGYESGAVDYIVKPFNPAILSSKVRVFLEMDAQKAELNRRREQIAAVNRELETFAYSVSHDLRAPLHGISGFSELLLEFHMDRLDEDGQEAVRRINSSAERMVELIQALLDLSRISRVEMVRELVDLVALARSVESELRAAEPDRDVLLSVEEDLRAPGDKALLRVVLANLIGNAWKFTGKQPSAEIEVGSTIRRRTTAFFVRDNGAGFDPDHSDRLFGPFQRLHSSDDFEGTGIGLATVRRVVNRHGGEVWAESSVGHGATFFFTLEPAAG